MCDDRAVFVNARNVAASGPTGEDYHTDSSDNVYYHRSRDRDSEIGE